MVENDKCFVFRWATQIVCIGHPNEFQCKSSRRAFFHTFFSDLAIENIWRLSAPEECDVKCIWSASFLAAFLSTINGVFRVVWKASGYSVGDSYCFPPTLVFNQPLASVMEGGIKDLNTLQPWEELENKINESLDGCDCIFLGIRSKITENKSEKTTTNQVSKKEHIGMESILDWLCVEIMTWEVTLWDTSGSQVGCNPCEFEGLVIWLVVCCTEVALCAVFYTCFYKKRRSVQLCFPR